MNIISMPTVIAAGAIPQFLTETVALIVAAAAIAYVCFRLKLVPIVGFLIAGVMIGPNALGLVRDQTLVDATAEIGVILLLFTIGIEFSLEKLASIKRLIFGGGSMQVGLTIVAVTALMMAFGVGFGAAVFTGMLVALSSTAIVLKLLSDRGETNTERGQTGIGLLIFQDLAIVVMVMIVPVLAGGDSSGADIFLALAKAGAIIAVVLVVARRVMPWILETVARTCSTELFLLTVIAICFGTAYLTSLAGVSLSLGAFLAGLMVSESRFAQHALSETLPLQILFSATFFVSVGMMLNVSFLVMNLPIVIAAIAVVLVIKLATTWVTIRALSYATPIATASAFTLAQIGEFSFVLERAGREVGLFPAGDSVAGSQVFIATTVVLMIATPGLMSIGGSLSTRSRHAETVEEIDESNANELEPLELEDHVIVAGYGRAARSLVRILAGSGIPFIITTLSPDGSAEAESEGLPVIRGDASRAFLLSHINVERSKLMVIADDDPTVAHRITSVARGLNPAMRIVVRTRFSADAEHLIASGADDVISEEFESIVQLFGEVLREYRIDAAEIDRLEDLARRNGYSALTRANIKFVESEFACLPGEDCYDSRTVTVRENVPAVGMTVGAFGERGIKVAKITRDTEEIIDPLADVTFAVGDEVVIAGATAKFAETAWMFRRGGQDAKSDANPISNFSSSKTVVDTQREYVHMPTVTPDVCSHLDSIRPVIPTASGCEECLANGTDWVHLRLCLVCGHVGCCDTSEHKHATKHFHSTDHTIMRSLEPAEDWAWCFADQEYV